MAIVRAVQLTKDYNGFRAVDHLDLEIAQGESFGLLGPNGAGKTTTISMLCGLLLPTQGDAFIDGHSITKEPMAAKKLISLVPQDIALYPTLSAEENLRFFAQMYGLPQATAKVRTERALEVAGLIDQRRQRVDSFSGGMKRRLNIAVGLLNQPQVLILDEPTVGVDPQSRAHILETIRGLNQAGMTVVYTSHYMEEVEAICHRVAIMDRGRVMAQGTIPELRQIVGEKDVVAISFVSPPAGQVVERVQEMPGVDRAAVNETTLELVAHNGAALLPGVLQVVSDLGMRPQNIQVEEPNLERVFLHLTGRRLRD